MTEVKRDGSRPDEMVRGAVPKPVPIRGEKEADLTKIGHTYPALVTAHFPDAGSAELVVKKVRDGGLNLEPGIQMFVKEAESDENPGLAPGEAAIIVQVADEEAGNKVVQLCERGGARHAQYYPSQRIGRG